MSPNMEAHDRLIRCISAVFGAREWTAGQLAVELTDAQLAVDLGVWDPVARAVDARKLGETLRSRLERPATDGARVVHAVDPAGKPRRTRNGVAVYTIGAPLEPFVPWPQEHHEEVIAALRAAGGLPDWACRADLVHLAAIAARPSPHRRRAFPGRPALQRRWGVSGYAARRVLGDERWKATCRAVGVPVPESALGAENAALTTEAIELREALLLVEPSTAALDASLGLRPRCPDCGRRLVDEVGPRCWRCAADEERT